MALILNIDTASENAHISFAENGKVLQILNSNAQKDHASFLQAGIEQLLKQGNLLLKDIDAIAVTAGPGSYTGLRVGMASAKGLCYALKKPLITLNTLQVMTASAIDIAGPGENNFLYCPMIDARRMEVFTAIYKHDLSLYKQSCAMILDETSFQNELWQNRIIFFGNGSAKWKMICANTAGNANFKAITVLPQSMSKLSESFFAENNFADLAYSEPLYIKEFQIVT